MHLKITRSLNNFQLSIISLIFSIALVGGYFHFDLLTEVDFNIHDSYVVVKPLVLMLICWVGLSFGFFLSKSIPGKFSNKQDIISLLIFNTLVIALLVYCC